MNKNQLDALPTWARAYFRDLLAALHQARDDLAIADARAALAHEKAHCLLGALLVIESEPALAQTLASRVIDAHCRGSLPTWQNDSAKVELRCQFQGDELLTRSG